MRLIDVIFMVHSLVAEFSQRGSVVPGIVYLKKKRWLCKSGTSTKESRSPLSYFINDRSKKKKRKKAVHVIVSG